MKILIAVLAILVIGLCGFLVYKNNSLSTQVTELKEALTNREALIAVQNAQIEKNALALENYKDKKQERDTKITTKYQKVFINNSTCEKELESIKQSLKLFF